MGVNSEAKLIRYGHLFWAEEWARGQGSWEGRRKTHMGKRVAHNRKKSFVYVCPVM